MRDPPREPGEILEEVIDALARWRFASVTELSHELWMETTHLAGFMKALEAVGLVTSKRRGGRRFYFLNYEVLKAWRELIGLSIKEVKEDAV